MDLFNFDTKPDPPRETKPLDALSRDVQELRAKFQEEYKQNQNLYDKRDYDRLMDKSDDWYARRWILYHQEDSSKAFEVLKSTLRWRREVDINDISYEDFPREFFELGSGFEYGKDKRGSRVMYFRCRLFKPAEAIQDYCDRLFLFLLDQCDKRAKADGINMIYDLTDTGLSNIAIPMIKFMISLLDKYPLALKKILITGLPWVLTPVVNSAMSMIPSGTVEFQVINFEELNQHIDESQIPLSMGGTAKAKFQVVPRKAKRARDFEDLKDTSVIEELQDFVDLNVEANDLKIVDSLPVIR